MHLVKSLALIAIATLSAWGQTARPAPQVNLESSTPRLDPETVLKLQFKNAMITEEQVSKPAAAGLVKIDPPLAGNWVWQSRTQAAFEPSAAPPMGTKFTFTMGTGVRDLAGAEIPGGVLKTISSSEFAVNKSWSKRLKEDYESGSLRRPVVTLVFRADVEAKTAERFCLFRSADGKLVPGMARQATVVDTRDQSYYWTETWQQRFENRVRPQSVTGENERPVAVLKDTDLVGHGIIVTPMEPLSAGEWKFHLMSGVPSKSGALSTAVHELGVGKVVAQDVTGASADPQANARPTLWINFAKPLVKGTDVTKWISISPAVPNPVFKVDGASVSVEGDFEPFGKYRVTCAAGDYPTADGLGAVANLRTFEVEFVPLEPSLALPSNDVSQYAQGARKYSVETVNLQKLRIRVKSLQGAEAIRAIQAYANYNDNRTDKSEPLSAGPLPFNLISGKLIHDKTHEFPVEINKAHTIGLNWSDMVPDKSASVLFLSAEGTGQDGATKEGPKRMVAQAVIQLTDIGMAWKLTHEEALIYAFSCQTGTPLPGVKMTLFLADADQKESFTTDATGVVRVPRRDGAYLLQADLNGDQHTIAFDRSLPKQSMWNFPVNFAYGYEKSPSRQVMLFTDRGLYRPTEEMHLKGIVRQRLDTNLDFVAEKNASLTITDPAGKELLKKTVTLSEFGTFDETFKLPAETVGMFEMNVAFPKPEKPKKAGAAEDADAEGEGEEEHYDEDEFSSHSENQWSFSEYFRVEEFRRNSFEVTVAKPVAATGAEKVAFQLTANYLMGQPLSDADVQWYARISNGGFYPAKHRDWLFGDHQGYDPYYWQHYFGFEGDPGEDMEVVNRGDGASHNANQKLGPDGKLTVEVPMPKGEFPTAKTMSLRAEVTDVNQQTLTGSNSTVVHPADLYVGVARQDQLMQAGQPVKFDVMAVNLAGEDINRALEVKWTVELKTWKTVSVKTVGGAIRTLNQDETAKVAEGTVALAPGARGTVGSASFLPEANGTYTLTVRAKDEAGRETASRVGWYVYGKGDYAWEYEEGARIRLVPERKAYKPGETARILVMTPIDGTALVTVERNKVLRHFVTTLNSQNPILEVPLEMGDAPNVYISVCLIKGAVDNKRAAKEPVMKLGYCELEVENLRDNLLVSLKPAKDPVRPGSAGEINGEVKDYEGKPVSNAEVTLWVVDEGVLQVMGYQNPDALGFFMPQMPLRVVVGSALRLFMTEDEDERYFFNKGYNVGGGGGELDALEFKLRKDFKACAFWHGAIRTGDDGKFNAKFTMPDSLTRFRVLGVALHGQRRMGTGVASLTVNKPLMIDPVVPRFASVKDQLVPKAVLHNTSAVDGTFRVSLEIDEEARFSTARDAQSQTATQDVVLAAGETKSVTFPVEFHRAGEAVWRWKAEATTLTGNVPAEVRSELVDFVESRFPVQFPNPLLRESHWVRLDQGKSEADLLKLFKEELVKAPVKLEVEIANSPIAEVGESINFLLHYPYGCVEQTSSSTIPWLVVQDLREHLPQLKKTPEQVAKAIQAGADRLLSMQTADGGLAYWPGGKVSEAWATSLGGRVLAGAKQRGANVGDVAMEKLANWLLVYMRGLNLEDGSKTQEAAAALHTLALLGKFEASYANKIYEGRAKLSAVSRHYLALAFVEAGKDVKLVRALLDEKTEQEDSWGWMSYNYTAAMRLMALAKVAPNEEATLKSIQALVSKRGRHGHWHNTWCNGWALLAMAEFVKSNQLAEGTLVKMGGVLTDQVSLTKNKPVTLLEWAPKDGALPELKVSLPDKKGVAFIRVLLAGAPALAPLPPVENGLSIERDYRKMLPSGKTEDLGKPTVGDLILVTLKVKVPGDISYVVIDDPLPASFEAVQQTFASQSAANPAAGKVGWGRWNTDHEELRDDRALFFTNHFYGSGNYQVQYLARVSGVGDTMAGQAKIEAMYDPERRGLSGSTRITTQPRAKDKETAGR